MRKSKIAIFTTFFVSPGDTPVAITQNVAWMKRQFSACQMPRSMYPSIFNSFSYSNRKCKKSPFLRTAAHVFVSPGDAPAIITQYVAWMERQFNACQTSCSMYLSIFNSFRVIRRLNQVQKSKNRYFYHIFVSPGDALWQSRKTLHEWKDNLVLAKPFAACTHLSATVSLLFEPQVQKIAVFTYRSPHFCFPWRRPCPVAEINRGPKFFRMLPYPYSCKCWS